MNVVADKSVWLGTGLNGELGSQLSRLYRDKTAAGVSRQIELQPLDLNLPIPARRIIHLAAKRPVHSHEQQIESNINYLKTVLTYAETNGVKEFIFFSSASLYNTSSSTLLTESDISFSPQDTYSATKLAGEELVKASAIPHRLVIRLPGVLELKGATNFISRAYDLIKSDQPVAVAHEDLPFNRFISASEIWRFLGGLNFESASSFDIVNLAFNADHTLKDLLGTLADGLNQKLQLTHLPAKTPHAAISTEHLQKHFGFHTGDAREALRQWARERR